MGRGVSRLRLRPRRTGFAVAATALVGTFPLVPAAPAETVPTATCTTAHAGEFSVVAVVPYPAYKIKNKLSPGDTVIALQLVPGPTFSPDLGSGFSRTGGKTKAFSPAGAAPGAMSAAGSSFSVQWLSVSTKGV